MSNVSFIKQFSLISYHNKLLTSPSYLTDKRLSTITFSAEDVGKITRILDPNKVHDHDKNYAVMLFVNLK